MADQVVVGGGQMGALIRAFDWAATPLGPIGAWPQSLRSAVSICLGSRFPIILWWGPELRVLYNDAYIPIFGRKHPRPLGQPGLSEAVWGEVSEIIGPMLRSVLDGHGATWEDDQLLVLERNGYPEEAYFTYSYSPIRDESGSVGGVFAAVSETTERVLSERRLGILRELGAQATTAKTAEEACAIAAQTLAHNPADVPFALVYLFDQDRERATLLASAGIEAGGPASGRVLTFSDSAGPWPLHQVATSGEPLLVDELGDGFGPLPGGPWPEASHAALISPLRSARQDRPFGALVAGVSPRRPLDDAYRGFFDLVAGHVATAVANATAYETERRRAEALAELDRAKTAFFSNVSHEFRTPLTLLLAPVEDALQGSARQLDGADLELVHRNGLRLLRLVNTLLDFSRIEAGRIQAAYQSTDLPRLTADLASTFRSAIERAGLRLMVDCPPLPDDREVYVDRDMWEKVVLNLLSNALKFTFEGEIRVSCRIRNGHLELIVQDTGIGVPAEELPRLFERFHRVPGARSRTHEGTGIGLALVHELVKLHGGSLEVASEVGRGTSFTVRLPAGRDHLPDERTTASRAPRFSTALGTAPYVEEALRWLPDGSSQEQSAPTGVIQRSGASPFAAELRSRVLIADDNADMRDYVARLLSSRYSVEVAADGEAALAAARQRLPGLVVADVMMPRLDGFGLLRALRADPLTRDVPVLLLSARAGEEAQVEGLAAGADDYLVKPFAARELLARVDAHIKLAQMRAEAADRERAAHAETEAARSELKEHAEHLSALNTALREVAEERDRARAEAEADRQRLHDLLMQAPAIICVLRGPEHVFELVNPRYAQLIGHRDVLGKPIREALPELQGQEFYELLDRVYRTGEPFVGDELLARLERASDGGLEEGYFNFVYQPSRTAQGAIEGILVHAVEVTDQVRARQRAEALAAEVARSEEGFRTLAENLPQLAWFARPDGWVEYFNQRWLDYSGLPAEQTLGESWTRMVHPEDLPAAVQRWSDGLRTGQPVEVEYRLRRHDGLYRWHLARAVALRDEHGAIVRWLGTSTDIHESKQADIELREHARQMELAAQVGRALIGGGTLRERLQRCAEALVRQLDGAFARVWTLNDVDNVLEIQASAGLYTHLDGAHGRVPMGALKIGLIAQERRPHLTNEVIGDPRVSDQEWATREGMIAFAGYPLIAGDEVVGVMALFARHPLSGTALDMLGSVANQIALGVARGRAEEERAQALAREREAREVVETINRVGQVLTAELNLQKLVQAVTDAATALTGAQFGAFFYNAVDARGERFRLFALSGAPLEAFAEFPMPRNTAVFAATFHGEGIVRLDDVRADPRYGKHAPFHGLPPGHLPVVSYLAVPVVLRSGEVLGGLFFGHPQPGVFTERAERIAAGLAAQASIAMDNARLFEETQAALRSRDEFLGSAAHDLKTPLTSIKGVSQVLRRRVERTGTVDPDRLAAGLQSIDGSATRMSHQIDELLDLARLRGGQPLQLQREPTDLVALARKVVSEQEPADRRDRIQFHTADQHIVGAWDSVRLARVLDNLIGNAIKYSPEGGPIIVTIGRETTAGTRWAVLSVRDQGVGIPTSDLPHVFERFYRGRNITAEIAGTGIGLASARQIVEQHTGTISVESHAGQGSTFTVRLPLEPGGAQTEDKAAKTEVE